MKTAADAARSLKAQRPELELPKMTRGQWLQSLAYSLGLTQWAVGVTAAVYVLLTQARYFGWSAKSYWDGLNAYLHFKAVPYAGTWLFSEWDYARHLYFRHIPEVVIAFAFVAMVVVKVKALKDKTPLTDRVFAFLHIPTPYQARYRKRGGEMRSGYATPAQTVLLPGSMFLASLPGQIVFSVLVFGGMAVAHRLGYSPPWLQPDGTVGYGHVRIAWVPLVIGIGAGLFYGHKPAVLVGATIQRFYVDKRLAVYYAAEKILLTFAGAQLPLAAATDAVTGMRRTRPSRLYPWLYRELYETLRGQHEPVRSYSLWSAVAFAGLVLAVIVLGAYGLYVLHWGVRHGFWMP
jgi:hypothetical protein